MGYFWPWACIILFCLTFSPVGILATSNEQSVSGGNGSSRDVKFGTLDQKRYCSNLKNLMHQDHRDGIESQNVATIAMSTATECERPLPNIANKELINKYRGHEIFKNIGKSFHENLESCVGNEADPAKVGKYYYYLGRSREGIAQSLSQAQFVDDMISSIDEKAENKKIECDQIKFEDLKSQCLKVCPRNSEKGESFLNTYQSAYDLKLILTDTLEKRKAFLQETHSMRNESNDPKCQLLKKQLGLLEFEYPLLVGDAFKREIKKTTSSDSANSISPDKSKFKTALLAELRASHENISNKIIDAERLQNCLSEGGIACQGRDMLDLLKRTPYIQPRVSASNKEIAELTNHQNCLFERKVDRDEIRSLLGGLARDAVLTFVSMGAGSLVGLGTRAEVLISTGIDSFFAAPSIKEAYSACTAEVHPNLPTEVYQCGASQKFVKDMSEHTECMKAAFMAAVNGLPVLPAIAKLGKSGSKVLNEESHLGEGVEKTNLSNDLQNTAETAGGDAVPVAGNNNSGKPGLQSSRPSSRKNNQNSKKSEPKNERQASADSISDNSNSRENVADNFKNDRIKSRAATKNEAKQVELEHAKEELRLADEIKHDQAYQAPGSLDRSGASVSELKNSHAQANFTKSDQSEHYFEMTSNHPDKYAFFTSRLNLIKQCNDTLLDKDACTALGHLFQDIYSEKMLKLKAKYPDLEFDSKLKLSEAAVPKNNAKLRALVEKATVEAENEWSELVKRNGYVSELIENSNKSPAEKLKLHKILDGTHWYTHGESAESRILAEKAAEFSAKNRHSRASDKAAEIKKAKEPEERRTKYTPIEKHEFSLRDRRRDPPPKSLGESSIARWEDVEKDFNNHVTLAHQDRSDFYKEIGERENGRVLKLLTENETEMRALVGDSPEASHLIKREVWEIVRKKQRTEEAEQLRDELNSKIRDQKKGEFAARGEGPNLTTEDVLMLQKMYRDLDPLSASPRSILRTPPEASQFNKTGGFSFDLSGFGARNIQNSEIALAKTGTTRGAKELFNEVAQLDKPTTKLLEDTGAQIYMAAKDFAKKNNLSIEYINRTGDDILLSFNRELKPQEIDSFLKIVSKKVPEKAAFRGSWVHKGVDEEMASKITNVGEDLDKRVRSKLKASANFMGANKDVNFLVERQGDSLNLIVNKNRFNNDRERNLYNNMSLREKKEFNLKMDQKMKSLKAELQKMLDEAVEDMNKNSSDDQVVPGEVRVNY
jgi:hypothetical protein